MLSWGVFLLAAGGVMLLAQAGALDRQLVGQALALWPLLLVAVGAKLLLRRTSLALPSAVIAALIPGLLLGGVAVAAPNVSPACQVREPDTFTTERGTFEGTATADLRVACGSLDVTTGPGTGWEARIGDTNGIAPAFDSRGDRLHLASRVRGMPLGGPWGGDAFRVMLPTGSTIDLLAEVSAGRGRFDLAGARLGRVDLDVNAGEAELDLRGATLSRISLEVNAGGATLRLPAGSDFGGDVAVNAGKLTICVPAELGLRIRTTTVLGGVHYDGRARTTDGWESPGFNEATHRAELAVEANVGSVEINPEGGCK